MHNTVVIALGSNLGHRLLNIQSAIKLIKQQCLDEVCCSIILQTPAILPSGAPSIWNIPYLNMVLTGKSREEPLQLLKQLKDIEKELGRKEGPRWAPRIIDLDILYWEGIKLATDELSIPHLELENRPFLQSLMAMLGVGPAEWRLQNLYPNPMNVYVANPQIMGILNITDDSFSDGGQYVSVDAAVAQAQHLLSSGATILDIGGQSTRPGAKQIGPQSEWARLKPVLEHLSATLDSSVPFSIDTYHPEVVQQLQHSNISQIQWINDVSGGQSPELLQAVANSTYKIVLMHSLGIPPSAERVLPVKRAPIDYIIDWGAMKLQQLHIYGIAKERVILDPGIGFGKSPYQSLALLRDIAKLKSLGCELLVGHSRKSFMSTFTATPIERDIETSAMCPYLLSQGVDYIRVHDVASVQRSLVAHAMVSSDA